MAMRHRIEVFAIIIALVVGIAHRYSEVIFGQNTHAALYGWHCGASVCVIALCYLAINPPSKRLRRYLTALYPILIAHLASDVFNRGDLSILDDAATGIAVLIITRTYIKQHLHGK